MELEIKMIVSAKITIKDDFLGFGGKKPEDWTEEEMNIFKNDIAAEFNMYDLGYINEKNGGSMVSNRRVISFE
jgi:hypothetical protein